MLHIYEDVNKEMAQTGLRRLLYCFSSYPTLSGHTDGGGGWNNGVKLRLSLSLYIIRMKADIDGGMGRGVSDRSVYTFEVTFSKI